MNVAGELRDHLQTFDEYLRTLGRKEKENFFEKIVSFQVNNRLIMINFDQL